MKGPGLLVPDLCFGSGVEGLRRLKVEILFQGGRCPVVYDGIWNEPFVPRSVTTSRFVSISMVNPFPSSRGRLVLQFLGLSFSLDCQSDRSCVDRTLAVSKW